MRLLYHRGSPDSDADIANYVYLRNLLTEASEKVATEVGPIEIVTETTGPFWDATHRAKHLGKKGLPIPTKAFGRGGQYLGTTLLLYGRSEGELEYFWHGREAVEEALGSILAAGAGWLAKFL